MNPREAFLALLYLIITVFVTAIGYEVLGPPDGGPNSSMYSDRKAP